MVLSLPDLNVDNLPQDLLDKGVVYTHNRDVDGRKLLVFDVTRHSKGKRMKEMKEIFLYFVERLERCVFILTISIKSMKSKRRM